jgi:hypothetical protein
VSPFASEAGTLKVQAFVLIGQLTIGTWVLTGQLLPVKVTGVDRVYCLSGLLMCPFGATLAEIRQQSSTLAVKLAVAPA